MHFFLLLIANAGTVIDSLFDVEQIIAKKGAAIFSSAPDGTTLSYSVDLDASKLNAMA